MGASAATLRVGNGQTYSTPCAALTKAMDGDTIEIQGNQTYSGDVCTIYANNLTIKGVNGRPKIDAAGKYSIGKGIWVVAGKNTTIDNVEMYGAKVPDRNGAALRVDGSDLTLRNSYLHDNENGILTNNDGVSKIIVENTEFGNNGYGDGYSHNLYIGKVASLEFRYNYSHDANVGHNLKSRANTNIIEYNRFSSTTGQPSYEIDIPNAGTTRIVGNIIQQPASNNNPGLVTYGVEGASNSKQDLYVVNNTFINDRSSGGTFLFIGNGVSTPVYTKNNLFIGTGNFSTQGSTIDNNNLKLVSYSFKNRNTYDLRPDTNAQGIDYGVDAGTTADGVSLTPTSEYLNNSGNRKRNVTGRLDLGAYESTSAAPFVTENPSVDEWKDCAKENETCQVTGTKNVRYGANGKYYIRSITGNVTCNNANFGDPIYGVAKTCQIHSAPPVQIEWGFCSNEDAVCNVDGIKTVRYGANGKYFMRNVGSSITCNNATFGDPIKNVKKTCDIRLN